MGRHSSGLLKELARVVDESVTRGHGWPKNAKSLSGQLSRLAPNLRAAGISITRKRDGHKRLIRFVRGQESSVICVTSVTSAPKDHVPVTESSTDGLLNSDELMAPDDANDANMLATQ